MPHRFPKFEVYDDYYCMDYTNFQIYQQIIEKYSKLLNEPKPVPKRQKKVKQDNNSP